ncbi:MAG: AMP-dependent synthetase, partial [Planctomycetaceae bacterium]
GKPVPSLQVRILENRWGSPLGPLTEAEHERRSLSCEQIGEIVVSGEHVLAGYLHGEGHDIHKYLVGETHWHRTGDAGYFDRHGRLWLMGRCTACIADDRGSLYPFAVEYAAMEQPSVARAALVPHRGQRVLAVQLKGPRSKSETQDLLRMLSFADLDAIRIVDELPVDRRHNSKIDYARLASLLERTL